MSTKFCCSDLAKQFANIYYEEHCELDDFNTRPRFYTQDSLIRTDEQGFTCRVTPHYVPGVPYYETYNDGRTTVAVKSDYSQIFDALYYAPVGTIVVRPACVSIANTNPEVFIKTSKYEWQQPFQFEQYGEQLVAKIGSPDVCEYVVISWKLEDEQHYPPITRCDTMRVTGENVLNLVQHFAARSNIERILFVTNISDVHLEWVKDASDVLQGEFA